MAKSSSRKLPIHWNNNEYNRLLELLYAISLRSEPLAIRINRKLIENFRLIETNPFIFEAERLKLNNDGSYRKFTVILVRISYKVEKNHIRVVRVRHTASEPREF